MDKRKMKALFAYGNHMQRYNNNVNYDLKVNAWGPAFKEGESQ